VDKSSRPAPPPSFRLNGNRDWLINVECAADAVVLQPTRLRVETAALAPGGRGAEALQQAVQQLIARRQATVRPGEPPYRPMIRFLLRQDGLRTYYVVYPVLGALGLPMTRENLQPEEAAPPAVPGR
jgi:hypothetical protein